MVDNAVLGKEVVVGVAERVEAALGGSRTAGEPPP
jgi:hypothetical protein